MVKNMTWWNACVLGFISTKLYEQTHLVADTTQISQHCSTKEHISLYTASKNTNHCHLND